VKCSVFALLTKYHQILDKRLASRNLPAKPPQFISLENSSALLMQQTKLVLGFLQNRCSGLEKTTLNRNASQSHGYFSIIYTTDTMKRIEL